MSATEKQIIKQVEAVISPVYLVGGSVRDIALGIEPKDWDFCTPLKPKQVEDLVRTAGKRPHLIGKRFGTIGFKVDGGFVEVTTFRNETYAKTRKPAVSFVETINEDLTRRDFTMNAIAQRGNRVIDPFGGLEDIKAGLIKAVGNPSVRFGEDPLRMLRAMRFAAQLGFDIDVDTFKSIQKNAHKILSVSRERWVQELDKLLLGQYVGKGLYSLLETDLVKFVLPEFRLQNGYDQLSDYHKHHLASHTIMTVEQVPQDINLRWAALLHDVAKPFVQTKNKRGTCNYVFHDVVGAEIVYGIGKRLKWSNERIATVSALVKEHLNDASPLREADNSSKHNLLPKKEEQ